MSQMQPRSGIHAWDEQDARSIASNTPSYGGALFAAFPAAAAALPPPAPRRGSRLRLATRVRIMLGLRPRLVRIGG